MTAAPHMAEALEACPFCGGDELSHGHDMGRGVVQCHPCNAYVVTGDEAEAIAAWNRRAPATCSDCPPDGYPTDKTRCAECPNRPAPDEKDAEIARLREALAARRVAKPLEWHKSHISSWNDDWHTITPIIFTIRCADENGWKWSGPGGFGYARSPAGAMADCQAECNRILAALSPT